MGSPRMMVARTVMLGLCLLYRATSFAPLFGYPVTRIGRSRIQPRIPKGNSDTPMWSGQQFATASSDGDSSPETLEEVEASDSPSEALVEQPIKEDLAMPWTDFQDWALRDNLPRYVVSIPKSKGQGTDLFALWRTMTREVTELSGYPIDFLQDMHSAQLKRQVETPFSIVPGCLPLLDEFDFESSGGVSGKAYGIIGVADGTNIVTPPVADVHITVPKGYVRTEDGSVAYELGTPLRDFYSLDGTSGAASGLSKTLSKAATEGSKAVSNLAAAGGSTEENPDSMLVRLGASTAIILGGALAVNMLSHHLTVNVFWV